MKIRRVILAAASLCAAATIVIGSGSAASASSSAQKAVTPVVAHPQGNTPTRFTTYTVIDKSYVSNYVNKSSLIARCYAVGGTCSISKGREASVSIGLSLGATRSEVAAGLSITASSSVSLTIGCTSPTLKSGESWSAYPIGRKYKYKVKAVNAGPGGPPTTTTSGYLSAFSPYSNQIYCTK
jgi:hypothetical protein